MPKRTRQYTPQTKFKAVLDILTGSRSPAQVARSYGVHPNTVLNWKQTFLERGAEVFEGGNATVAYERQIADLEQLLGKKEVEIALLKNFLGREP